MTLVQLRYFQAVCRCGSVLRAADTLHISQPSISSAIKELEKEFGVVLFQRQHRGMRLTEAGQQFLNQADHLLSHSDQARQAMYAISQKSRKLQLGVPPMIGSLFLPQIYYGFSRSFPDIHIGIEEDGRAELLRQLDSGQLDVAFLPHDKPFDSSLEAIHIADLETVCCVSLMHPLVNRKHIEITDLQSQPLALFKNSFFQTERIKQRFAACDITPNVLLYTDQLSTVRRMVARNIAAGFMFSKLTDSFPDVVSIPLDPPMQVHVSLVWHSTTYLSEDMMQFIRYIRQKFSDS